MHAEELRAGHVPRPKSANAPCVHVLFRFVKRQGTGENPQPAHPLGSDQSYIPRSLALAAPGGDTILLEFGDQAVGLALNILQNAVVDIQLLKTLFVG